MKQILAFLGARLSEPSSWSAIAALLLAGIVYPDPHVQLISLVLVIITAGVSFFLPEKMRQAEQGALGPLELRALSMLPALGSVPLAGEHPLAARVVSEAARQLLQTAAQPAPDPAPATYTIEGGTAAASVAGAAAKVVIILAALLSLGSLTACGSTGMTFGTGAVGQQAEKLAGLPGAIADNVIPASTPLQRVFRQEALTALVCDVAASISGGSPSQAATELGLCTTAQAKIEKLRVGVLANDAYMTFWFESTIGDADKAGAAVVTTLGVFVAQGAPSVAAQVMTGVATANVSQVISAIQGVTSPILLGNLDLADIVRNCSRIFGADLKADPAQSDFAPLQQRTAEAIATLQAAAQARHG